MLETIVKCRAHFLRSGRRKEGVQRRQLNLDTPACRRRPWLRLRYALSFFVCVSSTLAHSDEMRPAPQQLYHTAFTSRDGVPNISSDLTQTTDGYLWLASESGLYRFDGIKFERFTPAVGPQPIGANPFSLTALPNGGLWIGWRTKGASLLKNGIFTNYTEASGLPLSTVFSIVQDGAGRTWAGAGEGLYRFEGDKWRQIGPETGYTGTELRDLFVDRSGRLWLLDGDKPLSIAKDENKFHVVDTKLKVHYFVQDTSGVVWGMDGDSTFESLSLPQAMRRTLNFSRIVPKAIHPLVDRSGALWVGSTENGTFKFPGFAEHAEKDLGDGFEHFESKTGGLSGDWVFQILEDREGTVWVSTNKGLDRYRSQAFSTAALPSTFAMMSLLPSENGEVFIGPRHEKLLQYPTPLEVNQQSAWPDFVTCSYRDSQGVSWFGGPSGFWRKDDKGITSFQSGKKDSEVQAITGDGAGGVWISARGMGTSHYRDGVWTKYGNNSALPKLSAQSLMIDQGGQIWFGYITSMIAVLDVKGAVRIFTAKEGMNVGNVTALYNHGKNVWVGGENGLLHFSGGHFNPVLAEDHHELRGVSGIVERKNGDLWLNEATDVVLISAEEVQKTVADPSYKVHVRVFDGLDGLTGGAPQLRPLPTLIENVDGILWFSLGSSVAWLDPSNIPKNTAPPPVQIEAVADETVHRDLRQLRLSPDPSSVRVDYTGLSLLMPERVHFRYKLDGVDKGWQDAGTRRQAFYTKLAPGAYKFTVIASNNDGVWNDTGATVAFVIPPTIIETLWFKAFCTLAVLLTLGLIIVWRVNELTLRVKEKLSERLVERERIARELHDTLLQGFQGLVLKFQTATRQIPEAEPARAMMEIALDRADEVLVQGRDRVRDLRSEGTGTHELIEALASFAAELQRTYPVRFDLSVKGDPRPLHPVVKDEAYWIGREAMLNAFMHSEGTSVECDIIYQRDHFALAIRDDGIGIEDQVIKSGRVGHWGLAGMRERAGSIRAEFGVWSRVGAGTQIRLQIAANLAYRNGEATKRRFALQWNMLGGRRNDANDQRD